LVRVLAHRGFSIALRIAAGILAGVLASEVAFRVFVTPGLSPRPDAIADSFDAETYERRQIDEGVARSHFSAAGARLTGNPPLRSLPPALVLGDSYVEAEQVSDKQTMGSWLERLARENGVPLDVRQFGWLGASPAHYLLIADALLKRWTPSHVFIVLSANDFDKDALVFAQPSLRVAEDGTVRLIDGTVRLIGEPIRALSAKPPRGSALMTLARRRWELLGRRYPLLQGTKARPVAVAAQASPAESLPDSLEYARAPEAIVRALHEAYGSSLTLVYLAEIRLKGDQKAPQIESAFTDACARVRARCVSTREAMLAAYREGHVGHGAGVAPIGNGHLNVAGHEVLGRMMWEIIAPRSAGVR
jgi:hypothetical protein